MCILFIAVDEHPEYPLIIAANRDEFHQRATKTAHIWQDIEIFAGKDLQLGGTWLGINKKAEFAAITNIRDFSKERSDALSRGELVVKALSGEINQNWLNKHADNYNPFNLVYQQNGLLYCFNSIDKTNTAITKGFHAICNGKLDDIWPKMAHGTQILDEVISQAKLHNTFINEQALFEILKDPEQAPDELLPKTGIEIEFERLLSSIFIISESYGTRSSAVVLKNKDNSIEFFEKSYDNKGNIQSTNSLVLNKRGQYE